MMGKLPVIYRKSPPIIASFDFIDATSGAGYRRYYGACLLETTGSTRRYFLSSRVVDSCTGYNDDTNGVYSSFTGDNVMNELIDFDIVIEKPVKVGGGEAFVNFTYGMTDGSDRTCQPKIEVFHVRGAVETSLGSFLCNGHNFDDSPEYHRAGAKISLTSKQFASGDILRVTLSAQISNTKIIKFYHDPGSAVTFTDPNSRTIGTDLIADIPFKVEI